MNEERVIVYIDGFNLFYGMRARAWRRYYWLNVRKLSEGLLKPNQTLVRVKYYTSPVFSTPSDPDKARRQATYLEALKTLPDLEITFGKYQQKLRKWCQAPAVRIIRHE